METKVFLLLCCVLSSVLAHVNDNSRNESEVVGPSAPTTTVAVDEDPPPPPPPTSTPEDEGSNENLSVEAESLGKLETFLSQTVDMVLQNMAPMIVRSGLETNVSVPCINSVVAFLRDLKENKQWAFRMLDSNGKPPSGILQGTLMDFGSFDECIQLNVQFPDSDHGFKGQYCLMDIRAAFESTLPLYATPPKNIKQDGVVWDPVLRTFWARNNLLSFRYGLCVPSTCTREDLVEVANFIAEPTGMQADVNYCQTEKPKSVDKVQITILVMIATVVLITLFGTSLDVLVANRNKKFLLEGKKSLMDFLVSFSAYRNNNKFLNSSKKLNGSPLQHLNGFRFISLCWIIMGHTYFYTDFVHYHHYRRLKHVQNIDDDFLFMPIANFTLSVNTFFFISGLLVVYSNWKKLTASDGSVNMIKFFVHRIWRIWPPYLTIIGLVLVLPLLGSGPLWPQSVENTAKVCRENWWANVLFVNNFQPPDKLCMLHTWFLAATMQFYVISAVILMLLYKFPKVCISLLSVGIVTSAVGVFFYSEMNHLRIPTVIADEVFVDNANIILTLYIMPYNHFGSYLLGIIFGYLLVKYKEVKISWFVQTCGWIFSALMIVLVIFWPHKAFKGQLPSVTESGIYLASHRTLWALALGWIIFACATKRGGIINKFLSWNAFGPLSSLTFLAYLVHPLLMVLHTGSIRERVYFGHYELINIFLARTVMSFGLAYILFVCVELPFTSLEKYVFTSQKLIKSKATCVTSLNCAKISNCCEANSEHHKHSPA